MMKILKNNLGISLLLCGLMSAVLMGCSAQALGLGEEYTFYKVTIPEANPRIALIEAHFTLQDNLLYMSDDGPMPERWPNYVRNLELTDSLGNIIATERSSDGQWKVDAVGQPFVALRYEIVLDHEELAWPGGIDGVAFARDWGVFYTGRALFVMNGQNREKIQLSFNLPDTWHITTPWQPVAGQSNLFLANNLTDLTESMVFAGTHEETILERDGFALLFALGGEDIIAQKDLFTSMAEGVLDYYINLRGGIPNPPLGQEFSRSVVLISSGSGMDGEVIGNHINMIVDPNGDMQTQAISRFIFAHEFFHLWNGKTIRSSGTREDWFTEGLTNYYTLKALHHIGFLDDAGAFTVLNNLFYQRYRSDEGLGKISMRDAAGIDKDNHWGLIYGGGLFVGMSQDMIIRRATNNEKSIDDLIRSLYAQYGGTDDTFETADVLTLASELSTQDQSEFFNQYVDGIEPVLSGARGANCLPIPKMKKLMCEDKSRDGLRLHIAIGIDDHVNVVANDLTIHAAPRTDEHHRP